MIFDVTPFIVIQLLRFGAATQPIVPTGGGPIMGRQVFKASHYSFQLEFSRSRHPDSDDNWGGDGDPGSPVTHIVRFEGKYLGHHLLAGQSCYADLYDVRSVIVKPIKKGVTLLLAGGDAGDGYKAEIVFNKQGAISRYVYNREFPDQLYERAIYHWVTNVN